MSRTSGDLPQVSLRHQLLLLRHGETVWNREGRLQGRLDSPLTETGREQARRQGRDLEVFRQGLGPHLVFCSPLKRAQDTARLALGAEAFITEARLVEIGCGRWEGTTEAERAQSDPEAAGRFGDEIERYLNAPGGEGLATLTDRLAAFLADLEGPAVIFSHKVVLVTLRAMVTGGRSSLVGGMAPRQGTILELPPKPGTV